MRRKKKKHDVYLNERGVLIVFTIYFWRITLFSLFDSISSITQKERLANALINT